MKKALLWITGVGLLACLAAATFIWHRYKPPHSVLYSNFSAVQRYGSSVIEIQNPPRDARLDIEMTIGFVIPEGRFHLRSAEVAIGLMRPGPGRLVASIYEDGGSKPGKLIEQVPYHAELTLIDEIRGDYFRRIDFSGSTILEPGKPYWLGLAEADGTYLGWIENASSLHSTMFCREVGKEEWKDMGQYPPEPSVRICGTAVH